jgi:hypothetical protein
MTLIQGFKRMREQFETVRSSLLVSSEFDDFFPYLFFRFLCNRFRVCFAWCWKSWLNHSSNQIAFEPVGFQNGLARCDCSGDWIGDDRAGFVGEDSVGEGWRGRAGCGGLAVGVGCHLYGDWEVALNIFVAEAGLVAVLFHVPGEDADLVEVVGQACLVGAHDGDVDGNVLVGLFCVGVVDGGKDVGSDDALAFGVAGDGVGSVDVHHAAVEPAGVAFRVADEPPVLHHGGRGEIGQRVYGLSAFGCRCDCGRRLWGASAGRQGLGQGCAHEEFQLFAFGEPVKAFGVATGFDVHVDFVAHDGGGDLGIGLVLLPERFELIEDVLGCDSPLFDPALFAFVCLYPEEAAAVVEDLKFFAVVDGCGAIRDGCDPVAEEGLFCSDVDVLGGGLWPQTRAAGESEKEADKRCRRSDSFAA